MKDANDIEQNPWDCRSNDFFREDAHCVTLLKATFKTVHFSLKQIIH